MTEVATALEQWLVEAYELRFAELDGFAPELPSPEFGVQAVLDSLLRVRKRLDRVDGLLFRAARVKTAAQAALASAQAQVDDAWDTSAVRVRNSPQRSREDFTGPRERYAESNLAVLDLRREARAAEATAAAAKDAYDGINKVLWGLDALRQDHLAVLRAMQFESSLER